jgi:hypothetical protein
MHGSSPPPGTTKRPESPARPLRLVVGCDLGAPSELLRDALRIGMALTNRGNHVTYLVGDPIALMEQAGSSITSGLRQAPVMRAAPHLVMKRPPIDGFADRLAVMGFDDKQTLITLASVWNAELASIQPDAIIGIGAPILWLVGPAHAPTFAVGNGSVLAPALGNSFPRLTANSTPLASDDAMLDNANAVLSRMGQPSLATLGELVTECRPILYGLSALDPYLQLRTDRTTGLLGTAPSPSLPPESGRLAAFLDVNCPNIEMLILALAGFGHDTPLDICITGATAGMRRFLQQQPEVTLWPNYTSLMDRAERASVLMHHGVQDVTQQCLVHGRPQLIVPWTAEQEMLNYMVGWMGITWSKSPTISIDEMVATLQDLLHDTSLSVSAQHHARQLAKTDIGDALPAMIEQIEKVRELV